MQTTGKVHPSSTLDILKMRISFNSYELAKFSEIRRELELTIRELQFGHADSYLGKYKLIHYQAESKLLEFHKINATDDHQEYAHSGIILDAEETTAFFSTFDTVEREFHQIVQDLPEKSTAEKSASDSLQSL